MKVKNLKKELEQHHKRLAAHRDEMRDLLDKLVDLHENTSRAVEALDDAISILSETV